MKIESEVVEETTPMNEIPKGEAFRFPAAGSPAAESLRETWIRTGDGAVCLNDGRIFGVIDSGSTRVVHLPKAVVRIIM